MSLTCRYITSCKLCLCLDLFFVVVLIKLSFVCWQSLSVWKTEFYIKKKIIVFCCCFLISKVRSNRDWPFTIYWLSTVGSYFMCTCTHVISDTLSILVNIRSVTLLINEPGKDVLRLPYLVLSFRERLL